MKKEKQPIKTTVLIDTLKEFSLEECIDQIENVKQTLESNKLPLETIMQLYERGKNLSKIAQEKLNCIQFKYEELNKEG